MISVSKNLSILLLLFGVNSCSCIKLKSQSDELAPNELAEDQVSFEETERLREPNDCIEHGIRFVCGPKCAGKYDNVPLMSECQQKCVEEPTCTGWAYEVNVHRCELIANSMDEYFVQAGDNYISGVKECNRCPAEAVGISGSTIGTSYSASDLVCSGRCMVKPGCKYYQYDHKRRFCEFKSDAIGQYVTAKKGIKSGPSVCRKGDEKLTGSPVVEQGVRYTGSCSVHHLRSINECVEICNVDEKDKCAGWSYNVRTKDCCIHSSEGAIKSELNKDFISGPPGGMACTKKGVGINSKTYKTVNSVNTVLECSNHCANDNQCKNFTFNSEDYTCELKDEYGGRFLVDNPKIMSGPKVCNESSKAMFNRYEDEASLCLINDVDAVGKTLVTVHTQMPLEDCMKWCKTHEECQAFAFTSDQQCLLKEATGNGDLVLKEGSIVAFKTCLDEADKE